MFDHLFFGSGFCLTFPYSNLFLFPIWLEIAIDNIEWIALKFIYCHAVNCIICYCKYQHQRKLFSSVIQSIKMCVDGIFVFKYRNWQYNITRWKPCCTKYKLFLFFCSFNEAVRVGFFPFISSVIRKKQFVQLEKRHLHKTRVCQSELFRLLCNCVTL